MKRGAGQPFLATDDVRDLHQVVIHDVGQVVGGQVVCRLVEHFVVQDIGVDNHFAANQVVDMNVFVRFYLESHHVFLAAFNEPCYFLGRHG